MKPRPLFDELAAVQGRIRAAPQLWLGLDFDGTLVELHDDPFLVALEPNLRAILQRLQAKPLLHIAVISGRSLEDVRQRVGLPGIAYAGNHGLEIEAPGLNYCDPAAMNARSDLAAVAEQLREELEQYPGAWIEDKSLTLEVHYRRTVPGVHLEIAELVRNAARGRETILARPDAFGSQVLPVQAGNKGTAARTLIRHSAPDALPIFIGDSRTDEDAFAALTEGITICVGRRDTAAAYRVESPWDVARFLRLLIEE